MGDVDCLAEVERLLTEWGRWVWVDDGCGFTLARGGDGHVPDICDDDAERIDRIVAKLGTVEPDTANLLKQHYIYDNSYRMLQDQFGFDLKKVSTQIAHGKRYVWGALTNFSDVA